MKLQLLRAIVSLACAIGSGGAAIVGMQPVAAAVDPIEGKWYGEAGFPQDRVEIGLEFKRNEKQELKVFVYQRVMNFYGLEVPGVVARDGAAYTLKEYALALTLRNDTLEGTVYPLKEPLLLHRTDSLPREVPVPVLPTGPGPAWQAKLGAAIYAPAVVRDGVAYVGTTGGMFYAIDVRNGRFLWPFVAGRPIHGEALATDEHVYFVCDNGFLFKLDRKTGKEVWRYDLGDARTPRVLPHQVVPNSGEFDWAGRAPRPVLADGTIYAGAGDGGFHAIDAGRGTRLWRFAAEGMLRTDAVVDGPRVVFGSYSNFVFAVDRRTGQEVWRRDTRGPITGSPALVGERRETLIVGNRNGVLSALDPATGEVRWRMMFWGSSVESEAVPGDGSLFYIGSSDLRRISLIDARDGRVLWRTDVFGWAWPRPLVTDALVVAATVGGNPYQIRHLGSLAALDRRTGQMLWRWPMPESAGSWTNGFAASPAFGDGMVVIGGLDGTLYGFPIGSGV